MILIKKKLSGIEQKTIELVLDHFKVNRHNFLQIIKTSAKERITEAKVGTISTLTNCYRTVLVLEEVVAKIAVVRPKHSLLLDTLDTPLLGVPMIVLFIAIS